MVFAVFAFNFGVTCIIEGAGIYLLYKKPRYIYYTFLCNLLTNPLLNLLLLIYVNVLGTAGYYAVLAVLESAVVVAEAIILKSLCDFKTAEAFLVSVLLNVLSFGIGTALWALIA